MNTENQTTSTAKTSPSVGWYFGPSGTLTLRSDGSTEPRTKAHSLEDCFLWLVTYDRGTDEYGFAVANDDGSYRSVIDGALVVGAADTRELADTIAGLLKADDERAEAVTAASRLLVGCGAVDDPRSRHG